MLNDAVDSCDVVEWAREFVRSKKEEQLAIGDIDERLMIKWFYAFAQAIQANLPGSPIYPPTHTAFKHHDYVMKKSGGYWRGPISGWYRTKLNNEGYAVESMYEPGSVQIYPASALVRMSE